MSPRVVAIDVGSVRGNFAWAALDLPGRRPVGSGGTNPDEAATAVSDALAGGRPVALGFESPIAVPVGEPTASGWESLGRAREGEASEGRSRPWSAGAGSGALATGLVQIAWVLGRVESLSPGARCTTRESRWEAGDADVILWEAFVSGSDKPVPEAITQHAADAAAAAMTFCDRLEAGTLAVSDVTCRPHGSFNLAAAAAMFAGVSIDPDELRADAMVYRTRPGEA
jgi:hypothetical protein